METRNLHFVVEKNIPFIQGLLEPYGTVDYLASDDITAEAVNGADALLVRTRTRCDESLLKGSKCRLVATATIGTDHIDQHWCAANGIKVASAPGCNAPAVAQYVMSSVLNLANRQASQYTIGIVGVGNVGKSIEKWARQLDMRVMLNDPPRQEAEGGNQWSTLQEIAREADIITFHPTLNPSSYHLADKAFFDSLQRGPIIINAARGPVVDNAALVEALKSGQVHHAVIDTWENEPDINPQLLSLCDIATPHIAGYSHEGKLRATRMVLDAVSETFDLPRIAMAEEVPAGLAQSVNVPTIVKSYDPYADTRRLRQSPSTFEQQRNTYSLRHEVPAGKID